MDRETLVYVDLEGVPRFVGRLWSHVRKGRESASFEYDRDWLAAPERFAIEPALLLGAGPQHTGADRALFGALGDSAPDRWGRALMRREERRLAKAEGRTVRTLHEADFLLRVDDEARLGALRFRESAGGTFLAPGDAARIPPLVALRKLLRAADRVKSEKGTDEDLRLLLAPGSSLGGARPKASIRDHDGRLAIAKFPSAQDDLRVTRWEAVALALARKAGLAVVDARVEEIAGDAVLVVQRFDRRGPERIPFLSAMSMLAATDGETRSYLEIADALRQHGAAPTADLHELWRRIVFNVLVSNTDDHLRNHGFLYAGAAGWRLAPAYDLNPVPVDIRPRVLSTAIDADDPTASMELAFSVAEMFALQPNAAHTIARAVARAVAGWRRIAAGLGIAEAEIDRLSSAFEHDDLRLASRRAGS
jgi:serine/threonine-protein kinase HipA